MEFKDILRKAYQGDFSTIPERLLCLDPGHTTGWCLFVKGNLERWGQCETVAKKGKELVLQWDELEDLFCTQRPTHVVCENYRIYAHKLERHSFSQVETLRLIGGIDMMCHRGWCSKGPEDYESWDNPHMPRDPLEFEEYFQPIPIAYQMATDHKGFVSDDKLKRFGLYKEGMRHSRDAIRAGIYYLLITNKKK